jgi:hypothetical protein
MRIRNTPNRANQPLPGNHTGQSANATPNQARHPAANNTLSGLCPRMYWRSANPAAPPPESPTCLARGPDCCATAAVADVRRVA